MLNTNRLLTGTALSLTLLLTPALAQTTPTDPAAEATGTAEGEDAPAGEPVETQPANARRKSVSIDASP